MVLVALLIILFMALVVVVSMYFLLSNTTSSIKDSKFVIDYFEPDNDCPKITEMVNFHKTNGNIKYDI